MIKMNEERFEISVNQEDVQNIINCYEKDIKYIERLEDNWNKLKEWLEEEFKANENWYNSDLTPHDKGYYREEYVTIKHNIKLVQRKMQEIEGGMNE